MYELPVTVIINEKEYAIRNKADYRTILGAVTVSQNADLTESEKTVAALIIFYEDVNEPEDIFTVFDDIQAACDEMMAFIDMYGRSNGYNTHRKLVDWKQDETLIVSAINNVAKTEIRALPYLHWWTFISYYLAISGESSLATVIGIRDKISKGKKLEKYEQEFKRNNPQQFEWKVELTEEEKAFEKEIDSIWKD